MAANRSASAESGSAEDAGLAPAADEDELRLEKLGRQSEDESGAESSISVSLLFFSSWRRRWLAAVSGRRRPQNSTESLDREGREEKENLKLSKVTTRVRKAGEEEEEDAGAGQ